METAESERWCCVCTADAAIEDGFRAYCRPCADKAGVLAGGWPFGPLEEDPDVDQCECRVCRATPNAPRPRDCHGEDPEEEEEYYQRWRNSDDYVYALNGARAWSKGADAGDVSSDPLEALGRELRDLQVLEAAETHQGVKAAISMNAARVEAQLLELEEARIVRLRRREREIRARQAAEAFDLYDPVERAVLHGE